jgi:uncharacterized membrane protein YdfJ with MMPL/SSD domain
VALGRRLGRPMRRPGDPHVSLREHLRQKRAQTRTLLTPGERRFLYGYTILGTLLPPLAVGLLVFGGAGTRGVGVAVLVLALLTLAVPISPFLSSRARRRAGRHRDVE